MYVPADPHEAYKFGVRASDRANYCRESSLIDMLTKYCTRPPEKAADQEGNQVDRDHYQRVERQT